MCDWIIGLKKETNFSVYIPSSEMIIILVSPDNVMKALLSLMAFVRKMASDLLIRLDSFVCVCL